MKYTVDIEASFGALARCMKKLDDYIACYWDWEITVNASCIDYGIYFNFDLEQKKMEISNAPKRDYDDTLGLDEIIELINGKEEEEEEEE